MNRGVSTTMRLNQLAILPGDDMLTRNYEVPDRLPYSLPSYSRDANTRETSPAPCPITPPTTGSNDLETFMLLSVLVDALPKGLIVLSLNRDVIYWNQNAKRLCQTLSSNQRYWTELPTIVVKLCDQVLEANVTTQPVLVEYQTPNNQSFRLTACWLNAHMGDRVSVALRHQTYILVTVEDRDEVLQQDIQAEQKKFHLTNREAEIWLLLKREYSYQAIASALHISLNTVKTHVRNIHAKRHPYQSLPA